MVEKSPKEIWTIWINKDTITLKVYTCHILQKVFKYSKEKANTHILEIETQGHSEVWSGNKEKAEMYTQELHSHLLFASLQKKRTHDH